MRHYLVILLCLWLCSCLVNSKSRKKDKETIVLISTDYGDIKVKLYNDTPNHRDNFIKLVKQHFYDGLLFHRVIKEFVIQGGDPLSKDAKTGEVLGNGGPGYTLEAEILSSHFHKRGAFAAARKDNKVNPEKRSSGSQFYIVLGKKYTEDELNKLESHIQKAKRLELIQSYINSKKNIQLKQKLDKYRKNKQIQEFMRLMREVQDSVMKKYGTEKELFSFSPQQRKFYTTIGGAPHLDSEYTVFGEVIDGMDTVEKIASVKTDKNNRPLKDIKMKIKILK